MTWESDFVYYTRRERDERVAASSAANRAVQGLHLQLAERYAHRIWSLETAPAEDARRSA